jgi:mannose-6-phosphate isomerase
MQPIVVTPYLRPQIWGGSALRDRWNKSPTIDGPVGESWELSTHSHHVSIISEGPFRNSTLSQLLTEYGPEILGNSYANEFPLIVKLLDCQDLLSVQVHPNDSAAPRLAGERHGKTEAWYVLEARPNATIFAGLLPGVTPEFLKSQMESGDVAACLHRFTPRPGDCLFVPAGLVHAVGGGVVMAEVQQSSDATFRMFDWNRVDPATGLPRKLHPREALDAIDFSLGPRNPMRTTTPGTDDFVKPLVQCSFFRLDLVGVSGRVHSIPTGVATAWLVIHGTATLLADGYERRFQKGETVLVPASASHPRWHADSSTPMQALRIGLG